MRKITRADLMSLEQYAEARKEFRAKMQAHKKNRVVFIGDNMTLHFEDRLTMVYQIQEMLLIEKIFEPEAVIDEIETYNPLVPDGRNWKASLLIEFPDESLRRRKLKELVGVDKQTWVQVNGHRKIYAISNEDLDRDTEEKTASVHFMRFELGAAEIRDVKGGAPIAVGVDHAHYTAKTAVPDQVRHSLQGDLD